ncbi:MAG: hypothetical protein AB7E49_08970 [Campylobacterales bacterium]
MVGTIGIDCLLGSFDKKKYRKDWRVVMAKIAIIALVVGFAGVLFYALREFTSIKLPPVGK